MTWKILLTCFIMFLVGITLSTEQQIDLNRNKSEAKILSRKKRFLIFPTGSSFSVATCMTVGVYGNPQFSLWSWGLNYGFAYNLPSNSSYFTRPPDDLFAVPFFTDPMGPPPPPPPETPPPDTTSVPPSGHDIHDDYHDHYPSAPSDILGETNQQFPTDLPAGPAQRKYSTYYQPKYETKPMMQRRYRRDIYRNIESVINKMGYHGRDCILQALCEAPQIFSAKQRTMVQELIKTVFSFPKSKVLNFEHPELLIYDEAHRKGRAKADCEAFSRCGFSLVKMALGKYSAEEHLTFM